MKIGIYETHPAADLFPLLPEPELAALAADIEANGLRLPIVTHKGKVLDGRNRLIACARVGQDVRTQEYHDEDCTAFVLSVNVKRRHLTPVQCSTVSVEALPLFEAEARARQGTRTDKHPGKSSGKSRDARDDAATATGVNPHYVTDAKAIKSRAPDVFAAMQSGVVRTMGEAKTLAGLPPEKRTAALAKIADAPEKSRARAVVKEIALEEKTAFAAQLRAAPVPGKWLWIPLNAVAVLDDAEADRACWPKQRSGPCDGGRTCKHGRNGRGGRLWDRSLMHVWHGTAGPQEAR